MYIKGMETSLFSFAQKAAVFKGAADVSPVHCNQKKVQNHYFITFFYMELYTKIQPYYRKKKWT